MSFADVVDLAAHFSHGMIALNLVPEIEAEGKQWRFMGIQSKNRKEWVITNIANMHQCITSVALYDTLGPDAAKFVFNQTEMTSVTCSHEFIKPLCKLKKDD